MDLPRDILSYFISYYNTNKNINIIKSFLILSKGMREITLLSLKSIGYINCTSYYPFAKSIFISHGVRVKTLLITNMRARKLSTTITMGKQLGMPLNNIKILSNILSVTERGIPLRVLLYEGNYRVFGISINKNNKNILYVKNRIMKSSYIRSLRDILRISDIYINIDSKEIFDFVSRHIDSFDHNIQYYLDANVSIDDDTLRHITHGLYNTKIYNIFLYIEKGLYTMDIVRDILQNYNTQRDNLVGVITIKFFCLEKDYQIIKKRREDASITILVPFRQSYGIVQISLWSSSY
jgi:hypothetical protein